MEISRQCLDLFRYADYRIVPDSHLTLVQDPGQQGFFLRDPERGNRGLHLNASAALVWQFCGESPTLSSAVRAVTDTIEGDGATISLDVLSVFVEFLARGVIRFEAPAAGKASETRPTLSQADPGRAVASRSSRPPVDKRFLLISHRRSGTHYLWELMRKNLGAGTTREANLWDIPKAHRTYAPSCPLDHERRFAVYIIRDCRDVLVANYHYFRNGGEKALVRGLALADSSIKEFVRGEVRVDGDAGPLSDFAREYFRAPVEYWLRHTEWAERVFTVRYEDMKLDVVGTLTRIAHRFGLEFRADKFQQLDGLVGHLPRRGVVGNFRDALSPSDVDYVEHITGDRLYELGYEVLGSGGAVSRIRAEAAITRVVFINLDRRPDRAENTRRTLDAAGVLDYERFGAIDGRLVESVDRILEPFGMDLSRTFRAKLPPSGSRRPRYRAKAACWMSHFSVLAGIDDVDGWTLILEDDIKVDYPREVLVNRLWHTVSNDPQVDVVVVSQRSGMARDGVRRGTDGYLVRNRSASRLRELLRTDCEDVDTLALDNRFVQIRRSGQLRVAELSGGPWLECTEIGRGRDSDIERW